MKLLDAASQWQKGRTVGHNQPQRNTTEEKAEPYPLVYHWGRQVRIQRDLVYHPCILPQPRQDTSESQWGRQKAPHELDERSSGPALNTVLGLLGRLHGNRDLGSDIKSRNLQSLPWQTRFPCLCTPHVTPQWLFWNAYVLLLTYTIHWFPRALRSCLGP